jgi:acetoin utilization deacetylase AcuC-like enzyme/GNAT superfamily N-acetyltransferase
MIRFRRIFDIASDDDRRRFGEVTEMFRAAFPEEMPVLDRMAALAESRAPRDFSWVLLVAEDARGRILGFSFSLYFPELRFGYLYYVASHPERRARGIGGALYEATRELLAAKGARGLFLDAGPDEKEKLRHPENLAINRSRLKFYERYGALPVIGTEYDEAPNPANDGYQVFLLYDSLDRSRPLHARDARRFVRRMFAVQYGLSENDPYTRRIARSFRDDPVRLRDPVYLDAETAPAPSAETGRWLKPIKMVISERHAIHHLRERGYVERPVRIDAVLRGLRDLPVEAVPRKRHGLAPVRAVHDPHLVHYLEAVCAQLKPDEMVYPEVFPIRRADRRPRELASRAGYFCVDTFTPLTRNAWPAARAAVDAALTGADLLLAGERFAYALCRPPGHHAERAVYGGFCYLNNAAIAAHALSAHGRVALLDIDYHHGNGSQDIFYARRDVYTLSIHGTPNLSYPHFAGFDDERGEGEGKGFNLNFPLRRGVDDDRYMEVLGEALRAIRRFRPAWLVLSLGFDIMAGDPTGSFVVTPRGMGRIAEAVGGIGIPVLIVQEGGYSVVNLRRGARAFFRALGQSWY